MICTASLLCRSSSKKGYLTGKPYGGYETFGEGCHPDINNINGTEPAVVSFFEDESGTEYLCVVNASQTTPGVFRVEHDRKAVLVEEIRLNGRKTIEYNYEHTEAHWDGLWLHPGQMAIFRITHK